MIKSLMAGVALLAATCLAEAKVPEVGQVSAFQGMVCRQLETINTIFKDTKDINVLMERAVSLGSMLIDGKPSCESTTFAQPAKVLSVQKVGQIDRGGQLFDAFAVECQFGDGERVYLIWPEPATSGN